MKRPGLRRLLWLGKKAVLLIPDPAPIVKKEKACSFKIIGLASVAVGAAALGLLSRTRVPLALQVQAPHTV